MTEKIQEEIDHLNGSQRIRLRITGDEMNAEKGYELDSVVTSLTNFEKLVNKTYLHINDRDRFREGDSEKISIRLMEVREGSFLSELEITYESVILPVVPLVLNNREMIWGAIKNSYEFIKAKTLAKKEGKEVVVTQTANDNGININDNSGTVNIHVNRGIPALSEKLKPEFDSMTKNIDGRKVTGIEISEQRDGGSLQTLSLDNNDKELFKISTSTDDNEIQIVGKIIGGNYVSQNGKIEVTDSNELPVGEYRFSVSENLHAEAKWREMFLLERPYYCKRRFQYNPSNSEIKIIELIITDWDEDQWEDVS